MAKSKPKSAAKIKLVPYDLEYQPKAAEEMAVHLEAWLKRAPEDGAGVARALGELAQTIGMSQVARDAGMSRGVLFRALGGNGNPSAGTLVKVARALGVRPHALKG
jgi:probable addiction module antidote protein